MPLGNPTQAFPSQGTAQYVPTRNYGGGAGKIVSNPWGSKTAVPTGSPMPRGSGQYGFGESPKDEYGRPMVMDPRNKAEADNLLNHQKPEGQYLKNSIEAMRRRLLQGQNEKQQQ